MTDVSETTRCNIPEDSHLHSGRENLKSHQVTDKLRMACHITKRGANPTNKKYQHQADVNCPDDDDDDDDDIEPTKYTRSSYEFVR